MNLTTNPMSKIKGLRITWTYDDGGEIKKIYTVTELGEGKFSSLRLLFDPMREKGSRLVSVTIEPVNLLPDEKEYPVHTIPAES
jgi:DNA-binding PadR family transcriptional regulator